MRDRARDDGVAGGVGGDDPDADHIRLVGDDREQGVADGGRIGLLCDERADGAVGQVARIHLARTLDVLPHLLGEQETKGRGAGDRHHDDGDDQLDAKRDVSVEAVQQP